LRAVDDELLRNLGGLLVALAGQRFLNANTLSLLFYAGSRSCNREDQRTAKRCVRTGGTILTNVVVCEEEKGGSAQRNGYPARVGAKVVGGGYCWGMEF
jgi:hypothetical protein